MWMPLGLLTLHRMFEAPSWRWGLALGATVAAQILCSIYYGVFLAVYLSVAWLILALQSGNAGRISRVTAAAALPLLLAIAIYGPPYAQARSEMGPRSSAEISEFSASPSDYLAVAPQNRMHRALGLPYADDEHSLFPGFVAIVFAAAACWPPVSRLVWLYAALALFAFDASLGANGFSLFALGKVAPIMTSLRSSARFGILTVLSLAVLAAIAAARLQRARTWGTIATSIAILLVIGENMSLPIGVRGVSTAPSDAHLFVRTLPRDLVVVEMPMPRLDSLWLYETTHQLQSINHWRPLINGYSGFVPAEYAKTLTLLSGFPDERSAQRMRELGVGMVLVNRLYYEAADYKALEAALIDSPYFEDFRRLGRGNEEVLAVRPRR